MTRPASVLIADNDEHFREWTKDLLSDHNIANETAADAEATHCALKRERFDVLVISADMPGNETLQLAKCAQDEGGGISLVITARRSSAETAMEALNLRVAAYLIKPLDEARCLSIIKQSIDQARTLQLVQRQRRHHQAWGRHLETLEKSLKIQAMDDIDGKVEAFAMLSLGNLIGSALDLQRIAERKKEKGKAQSACRSLDCPRAIKFVDTIKESIDVLNKTKGQFKSRVLKDLRQKLQETIDTQESPALLLLNDPELFPETSKGKDISNGKETSNEKETSNGNGSSDAKKAKRALPSPSVLFTPRT